MTTRYQQILALCLGVLLLPACTSRDIRHSRYFSEQHRFPAISYSGHSPSHDEKDLRAELFVIPDDPGMPYHSDRTLLLRIDEKSQIFSIFFLFDLYPDHTLNEAFWDQPLYYLIRIEQDGPRTYWAGPYRETDPLVQTCLNRDIDFSKAFSQDTFAESIAAFIEDMRFCHGGKHDAFENEPPYVINWPSISRALMRLRAPDLARQYPDAYLSARDDYIYIWAPVMAASGEALGGYDGALSTGLDFDNGRVTLLWIDMN